MCVNLGPGCCAAAWKNLLTQSATLGPVDKPDPVPDATEQDEAEKAAGSLVIARCNAPLLLEMADAALECVSAVRKAAC